MKASALTLLLATAGLAAAHPIASSSADLRIRADQEASTESVTSADQLESTRRIHFPGTGRSADSANVYVNGHWGGRRLFPGATSSSAQQKRADDDNSEEVSVADLTSDGTSSDQIGASGMRRIHGIGRREDGTEKEAAASEQPAAVDQKKEEKTDAAPATSEQPASSTSGDDEEDDDPDSHGRMRRIGGPGKRDDEGTQTVDTSEFAGDGASADEIEASQTRRIKGFPPRRLEHKRQDSQTVNVGDLDTDGDADDVDDSKRRRIKGFPPRRREQAKRADTETVSVSDLTSDGTSADELEASQTRRIKGVGKRQDTETVNVSDLTSDGTSADDLEASQTRRIKGIGGGKLARGFEA